MQLELFVNYFYSIILDWNVVEKTSVLSAMNLLMVLWNFRVVICCASSALFYGRRWSCTFVLSATRHFQLISKLKLLQTKSKLFLYVHVSLYVCGQQLCDRLSWLIVTDNLHLLERVQCPWWFPAPSFLTVWLHWGLQHAVHRQSPTTLCYWRSFRHL